jgi:hypothetical protein
MICRTDPHSGASFSGYLPSGGGPRELYLGEFLIRRGGVLRYRDGEFWMDALICAENVPIVEFPCAAGGADQWSQYAHDAQRTSASNVNVGDPNGIKLEWTSALPRIASFTSPTIANDRVYISSDRELWCYDLATPTVLGSLIGIPEMGSDNRGHATVDAAGNVYATGVDGFYRRDGGG